MDSLQDGGNWQQDEGEEPEIFLPLLHLLLWELWIKIEMIWKLSECIIVIAKFNLTRLKFL